LIQKELWFKNKKYGWGWTPVNFKGWLAVLLYVVVVSVYPLLCQNGYFSFSVIPFLVVIVSSTVLLLALCYAKGEKPAWRWGDE
jgi:hypothetical protein